jgi:hypothetical protein
MSKQRNWTKGAVVMLGVLGALLALFAAGVVMGATGNAMPLTIVAGALVGIVILAFLRASGSQRPALGGGGDGGAWLGAGAWYGGDGGSDCGSAGSGGGDCGGGM